MLKSILKIHIPLFIFLLFLGVLFGVVYAFELIGIGTNLIRGDIARSLHISFMLYGSILLMLSLIPLRLFDKDGIFDPKAVYFFHFYLLFWYIFLTFMAITLLMGITRGLPFYDFDYKLNFILAFSGIYYLLSMLMAIRHYKKKPLWVKISLFVIVVSPFLLLFLMNPKYGEVEKTLIGPHGDNTLGMSFALIVIYYLVIKSFAIKEFRPKYNFLWVIPLVFYIFSLFYKSFYKPLTYNQEWFLQYLTLLYIPLLIYWYKKAEIDYRKHSFLLISIIFFILVDIEGNWLFIPHIREIFHRNDLVVGHAHLAVGGAVLFLALSVVEDYIKNRGIFYFILFFITLMAFILTIGGFAQGGYLDVNIESVWKYRAFSGFMAFLGFLFALVLSFPKKGFGFVRLYHLVGFLSDGLGGLFLLFFGEFLYSFLNEGIDCGFSKAVFGFMIGVGAIHLVGYLREDILLAKITVFFRIVISAVFYSLFISKTMGISAIMISVYDFVFAMIFIIYLSFKGKNVLYKKR